MKEKPKCKNVRIFCSANVTTDASVFFSFLEKDMMTMEIKSKVMKTQITIFKMSIVLGYFYSILFYNNYATFIVKIIFINLFWDADSRF